MHDAKSADEDDAFFDASDEFPFYDCPITFESFASSSSSSPQSTHSLSSSYSGELRRRRSLSHRKLRRDSEDRDGESGKLDSDRLQAKVANVENNESSVVTAEDIGEESFQVIENDDGQVSFLVFLAELVVKAIGFQFNLLIGFITFPFLALYYSYMLVVNPFSSLRLVKDYLTAKLMRLWNLVGDTVNPFVSQWLKEEHKSLLNFALRCGWGLFWSIYVCSILVTLLISAFVIAGLIMRYYVVEEPFQLKQALNFDFTKSRPVALVPITACPTVDFSVKNEVGNVGGVRVIPSKHKLQAIVTLILPESNYNRNLGIFQVRVEFLSDNGRALANLSRPCMLEFRSEPIRLLLTFCKIIPLVAGYVSESQTLNLDFRGYTEAVVPTACLKVTLEQRAEYRPGAGIPEVYDAFLHLESELPFLKRILWYWRKTIFVWVSMMLFMVELLFACVCCRPVIIPRARTRGHAISGSGPQTSNPNQG